MNRLHRRFAFRKINNDGNLDFTRRNHVNVHAFLRQRFKQFSGHARVRFHADTDDGQLADFFGGRCV